MSMGIGINTQNPDEGELKRDLEEIACGVWFTSTGAVMPKLVKYQDEEGLLHTISQIRVLTQDKKFYCGIPIQEYDTVKDFNSQMSKLKSVLREPNQKISFADDPTHYFIGTPKLEVTAGTLTPTGKITFTLNDPFLYEEETTQAVNGTSISVNNEELAYDTLPNTITVTMAAGVSNFSMTNGSKKFTTTSGVGEGDTIVIDFSKLTYVVNKVDQTANVSLQSNFGDFYIKSGDTINVPSASKITLSYNVKTL